MNEIDLITDAGKTLKINNTDVVIKKIRLIDWIRFSKSLAVISTKYSSQLKSLDATKSDAENAIQLCNILDEKELFDCLCILTSIKDSKFFEDISLENLVDIITAIVEVNNFGDILKKVTGVVEKLTKQMEKKK